MNLLELKKCVDNAVKYAMQPPEEISVQIQISRFSIGPTPSVMVRQIHVGFDWDRGKILIRPETPLKEATQ